MAAEIAKLPFPFLDNTTSDVMNGIFVHTATMVNPITYQEYLVPFSPPADGGEFKLDPNHKDFRRKKIRGIPHIFVKWKGWPKKFNQCVKESDIRRFI